MAQQSTAVRARAKREQHSDWTAPKTNWHPRDAFSLVPDYARVRGNLLHLHALAAQLHLPFSLAPMCQYSITDVPDCSFFAAVDENTDALWDNSFRPVDAPRARAYSENGPVWTADDLNRIETAHVRIQNNLTAQKNARKVLQFTMGGGLFATCL